MDQAYCISTYSPLQQAATISSSSAMCRTVWVPTPELWLAWSYTGLEHSVTALWVPVWNGPITSPQSSQTSDSYNPLLWWFPSLEKKGCGTDIPLRPEHFSFYSLHSGQWVSQFRSPSTAERSSLMRVLLFFPPHTNAKLLWKTAWLLWEAQLLN